MSRRSAALLVALAIFAVPLALKAQVRQGQPQVREGPLIGVLAAESPEDTFRARALRDALREVGYVQGRNISFEWRWGGGVEQRFPEFAAELVRLKPFVIVASNDAAIQAAKRATKTIAIVMVYPSDPVGLGFVASLKSPGGNITGMTSQSPDLPKKRLQLLKEAVPKASRVTFLFDATDLAS